MKRWNIVGEVTVSVYATVKARTRKEAREIAESLQMMTLCHQCSESSEAEWTPDSLDGEPRIIECEEAEGER